MKNNSRLLLDRAVKSLYTKKASNLLAIDVRNMTQMVDFVVIAEGNVDRHLEALAREVKNALSIESEKDFCTEGVGGSGWVVVDCFDIVVHLFLPKIRDIYRIEQIYKSGSILDLEDLDPKESLSLRSINQ